MATIKRIRKQRPRFEHMRTSGGNDAVDQVVIYTELGAWFMSYGTAIVFRPYGGGPTLLDETYWDYSRTTGKYRGDFLGEYVNETREGIKSGRYKLADLNG